MKTGRNDVCPCGSGLKYKKCCAVKDQAAESADFSAKEAARAAEAAAKPPEENDRTASNTGANRPAATKFIPPNAGKIYGASAALRKRGV